MDKNFLQPQSSEDNGPANDIKQKRAYLTHILVVAAIVLGYGVANKDTTFIWAAIALFLMQETQPTIKKFLLLLKKGKILSNNSRKSKDKDA